MIRVATTLCLTLFVLSSAGCADLRQRFQPAPRVEVRDADAQPADFLECAREPLAPVDGPLDQPSPVTQEEFGRYVAALIEAGADCRAKLDLNQRRAKERPGS